jgi:hypothetical protein
MRVLQLRLLSEDSPVVYANPKTGVAVHIFRPRALSPSMIASRKSDGPVSGESLQRVEIRFVDDL